MKIFVALSAILAVAMCEDEAAKVVLPAFTTPLAYAAGLPIASAGLPIAAGAALTYTAAAPAVTYAAAAPAPAITYTAAAAHVPAPAVTYTAAAPVPAVTYTAAAPAVAYTAAPVAVAAPYVAGSQYHAQDEFGNLNYGYNNLNSAKQEVGNTYGGVSGAYSYVDADGKLQQVTYQADALGFRTQDSRLPVAPTFNPEPLAAPVYDGVAPLPVEDTPEVAAARAEHLAALEAANAGERRRREADPALLSSYSTVLTAPTPLIHNAPVATYAAPAPLTYPYGIAAYSGLPAYTGLPAYSGLYY